MARSICRSSMEFTPNLAQSRAKAWSILDARTFLEQLSRRRYIASIFLEPGYMLCPRGGLDLALTISEPKEEFSLTKKNTWPAN